MGPRRGRRRRWGWSERGRRLRLPRALPWEVGGGLGRRRSDSAGGSDVDLLLVGLRVPSRGGTPIGDVGPVTLRRSLSTVGSGCPVAGGSGAVTMAVGSARHRGAGRRGWGWSSVRVGAFSTGCGDRSAAKARPSTTRRDQGRAPALRTKNPLEGRRLPSRVSERHRPAARLMRFLCWRVHHESWSGVAATRGAGGSMVSGPAESALGHPERGARPRRGRVSSSVRGRRLPLPRALPWEVGGGLRRRRSDSVWGPLFICRLVGLRAPSGTGHRSGTSAPVSLGRGLSAVVSGCRVESGAASWGSRWARNWRGRATRLRVVGEGSAWRLRLPRALP
jgi:hypothetical protein